MKKKIDEETVGLWLRGAATLVGVVALMGMAVLVAFTGCTAERLPEVAEQEEVEFVISAQVGAGTKSSVSAADYLISNVGLYVYSDGSLIDYVHVGNSTSTSSVKMALPKGKDYVVYALANVGEVTPPLKEADFRSYRCSFSSLQTMTSGGLPMASVTTVTAAQLSGNVSIEMIRLVSKISFVLDDSDLSGVDVQSIRIRQAALDICPFQEGSTPTGRVADGDYATSADVRSVNAGGEVFFYVLENCQGVLLPNNKDQWAKVPDNIPAKADVCTYMEVEAFFDGSSGVAGTALYRFFLGKDNTTDFDVERNVESTVTLKVTGDGLGQESWRIDSSGLDPVDISVNVNPPQYTGQWGTITFPTATTSNPVSISRQGQTLTFPNTSGKAGHIGNIDEDSPDIFIWDPLTPNTIHYCLASASTTLTVSQGLSSTQLGLEVDNGLIWAIETESTDGPALLMGEGTIVVNEDGSDVPMTLYLADPDTRTIVSAATFVAPERVRAYLDAQVGCIDRNSHIYWYYDMETSLARVSGKAVAGVVTDFSYRPALTGNGESYLYVWSIHGLQAAADAAQTTTMKCIQNFCGAGCTYNVQVNQALPSQRHLGEVYNYSLALGDLKSSLAELPLFGDLGGSLKVNWTYGWGKKYSAGDEDLPVEDVIDQNKDVPLMSVSSSGTTIRFRFPHPSTSGELERLAGGTIHLRASVENPYSGRKIVGDYSVDVRLYLVLGFEADIYRQESNQADENYLDFRVMPVMERTWTIDDEQLRNIWEKYTFATVLHGGDSHAWGERLTIPPLDLTEFGIYNIDDLDNDSRISTIKSKVRSALADMGTDFRFKSSASSGVTVLKGSAGDYLFELHRLQDIVPGTYLIEEYFGSYTDY